MAAPTCPRRIRFAHSAARRLERAAAARRQGRRATCRPDHAHAALHGGSGAIHPREKGGAVLPLFAHTFPHVPMFASAAFKGQSRAGIYGDAVEETRLERGPAARRVEERRHRGAYARLLHQRQRPVADHGRPGRQRGPAAGRQRQHVGGRHARAWHRLDARPHPAGGDLRTGARDGPVPHGAGLGRRARCPAE